MLSVSECADYVGLKTHELLLGPSPSAKHKKLLDGYLANRWRGDAFVAGIICDDLRAAVDLGARARAADLLLVLRLFLTERPSATCAALLAACNITYGRHKRRHPQLICLSFEPVPA